MEFATGSPRSFTAIDGKGKDEITHQTAGFLWFVASAALGGAGEAKFVV